MWNDSGGFLVRTPLDGNLVFSPTYGVLPNSNGLIRIRDTLKVLLWEEWSNLAKTASSRQGLTGWNYG